MPQMREHLGRSTGSFTSALIVGSLSPGGILLLSNLSRLPVPFRHPGLANNGEAWD